MTHTHTCISGIPKKETVIAKQPDVPPNPQDLMAKALRQMAKAKSAVRGAAESIDRTEHPQARALLDQALECFNDGADKVLDASNAASHPPRHHGSRGGDGPHAVGV